MRLSQLLVMGLLGFTSSALAAEVDFSQVLNGIDGKPLTKTADTPMTTLGDFTSAALMTDLKNETPAPTGQEKVKRWVLAMKIEQQKTINLDSDDMNRIKTTIALAFSPLVVGQVWSIVDPASVK